MAIVLFIFYMLSETVTETYQKIACWMLAAAVIGFAIYLYGQNH